MSTIVRPYTHVQETPASEWIIKHNLNRPAVDIVVYNVDGQKIRGKIERVDNNTSKVSFKEKGVPKELAGVAEAYNVGCIPEIVVGTNLQAEGAGSVNLTPVSQKTAATISAENKGAKNLSLSKKGNATLSPSSPKRVSLKGGTSAARLSLSGSKPGSVSLSKGGC